MSVFWAVEIHAFDQKFFVPLPWEAVGLGEEQTTENDCHFIVCLRTETDWYAQEIIASAEAKYRGAKFRNIEPTAGGEMSYVPGYVRFRRGEFEFSIIKNKDGTFALKAKREICDALTNPCYDPGSRKQLILNTDNSVEDQECVPVEANTFMGGCVSALPSTGTGLLAVRLENGYGFYSGGLGYFGDARSKGTNDMRSNTLNPNNPSHQAAVDNRTNQLNPRHPAYRSSRGTHKGK